VEAGGGLVADWWLWGGGWWLLLSYRGKGAGTWRASFFSFLFCAEF